MGSLEDRVKKFRACQLPGQPMGMHLGTLYLVNDLWREVERLRRTAGERTPQVTAEGE